MSRAHTCTFPLVASPTTRFCCFIWQGGNEKTLGQVCRTPVVRCNIYLESTCNLMQEMNKAHQVVIIIYLYKIARSIYDSSINSILRRRRGTTSDTRTAAGIHSGGYENRRVASINVHFPQGQSFWRLYCLGTAAFLKMFSYAVIH